MRPYVPTKSASASEASTIATAAAAAAATSAAVATPTAVPSTAATSAAAAASTPAAESWKNSGTFLPQKPLAAEASSVRLPETMDLRDRLFAGISEEGVEEGDDDGAEVVIEPDGRIKVHPRRRPNYLRYGGALEPPSLGASLDAERGAIQRDTRVAEDLLLLQLLRNQHQDRSGPGSGLDSLLEEEVRKLLVKEATTGGAAPNTFAGLETGSRSDADSSSGGGSSGESRILTTPAGYFVAFIVGFGGILLIAMLCCVIRAAYVKRQKARLKKLLAEKLRGQTVEEPEHAGLSEPAFYEVVEGQPPGATPSEDLTADPDWIDVRVEQQAPPEEQQMMNVARLDTLSKAGLPTESTEEEKRPEQLPYKSKKKQKKKSAHVGLWGDEELDREKSRDKLKSRKKSSKASDVADADVEKGEEKRRRATRRGKELKKALSSRRTLRLAG